MDKCINGDAVSTGCLVFEETGRHACTCDVPEDSCTTTSPDSRKVWTDACTCHPGCYDQGSHMCECDTTAEECNATEAGFFTAMCSTKCEDEGRHAAGCLKGFTGFISEGNTEGTHRCDCDVASEEDCSAEDGLW